MDSWKWKLRKVRVKPSTCSMAVSSTAIQLSSTRPDQKEIREARGEIPAEAADLEAGTAEAEVVADTKKEDH